MTEAARFRAFGMGCAKTGTNSLAGMFARRFRSQHEPKARELIEIILNQPRTTRDAFRDAVHGLIEPLDLEMNSSQLNGYIAETMAELYGDAKFVLTVREPASWVRSFVNHQMTRAQPAPGSPWERFRDLRFLGGAWEGERPAYGGIYTVEQYLSYWLRHNEGVIKTIPAERLLVVRTERLDEEIPRLAAFLGIPANTISRARANPGRYGDGVEAWSNERELARAGADAAAKLYESTGFDARS